MEHARKIVYVLTDPQGSAYSAMTAVSAAMTKRLHPNYHIDVVCDRQTDAALRQANHPLLKHVDALVACDTPTDDAKLASRFLKTSLRRHVKGDFLFLDVDAFPVRSIDRLFRLKADFAVSLDLNLKTKAASLKSLEEHVDKYQKMNWPLPPYYANSGVFFARDNAATHAFFDQWHARWQAYTATGFHHDQPSFNYALSDSAMQVQLLPARYNAMILVYERSAFRARIVHLFSSIGGLKQTVFHDLVQQVQKSGVVDPAGIEAFFHNLYFWRDRDRVRRNLHTGHPVQAARVALSRLMRHRRITVAA